MWLLSPDSVLVLDLDTLGTRSPEAPRTKSLFLPRVIMTSCTEPAGTSGQSTTRTFPQNPYGHKMDVSVKSCIRGSRAPVKGFGWM